MIVVVAIALAVVLTVIAIPYRDYAYHLAWSPLASTLFYTAYLIIGGASGWVGYRAGTAIGWKPTDSHFFRGVVYGSFGQAVVRVHLKEVPGAEAGSALTILGKIGDWLTNGLEVPVERAMRQCFARLSGDDLAQYVLFLFLIRVKSDEKLDPATREALGKVVNENIADLTASGAASQQARASLRALAEQWAKKYKFDPPEPV